MEQFRQIGEALGSLKALMVFKDSIQINQRQCCLLLDMFASAYDVISEEMTLNLRFEEKNTKWRVLEHPLRELHRSFKEGEQYVRHSLENKDWWAKAITLYQNKDCVEFHIHNLLCCVPIVIEAIEMASEISGSDPTEIMQKKKLVLSKKYQKDWKDPILFQWRFGKQYLVSQDLCNRLDGVWREDRWVLLNKVRERKASGFEQKRLIDLLAANLDWLESRNGGALLPSSILVGSKDYQVRRRLGNGSQCKEIQWLGESFVLRHFFGDIEPLVPEISSLLSLSHPHIMQFLCGFTDEEKKECFLVTELMSRNLCSYIKEICGPRKRVPFSLPVAVDLMLQIARGMEYLHSKKIYHGELNPSNILVKARGVSTDGYLHSKISGFGLSCCRSNSQRSIPNQNCANPFIWYAPEVLMEQEQCGSFEGAKYTEKSDVYSFGMICFELMTGKVPFEDSHLQGDKMSRNVRAGERPLFPFHSPKYVTNLTKKCWHSDPNQRPSFSSISRILRYIKRFLTMNPDHSQPESPMPMVDYCDIEARLLREFSCWGNDALLRPISEIPFQMFAYRTEEKEKLSVGQGSESGSDVGSFCGDDNVSTPDESLPSEAEKKSIASPDVMNKKLSSIKRPADVKAKQQGSPRGQALRPPQMTPQGRRLRMNSEPQLMMMSPRVSRASGHVSDSDLP